MASARQEAYLLYSHGIDLNLIVPGRNVGEFLTLKIVIAYCSCKEAQACLSFLDRFQSVSSAPSRHSLYETTARREGRRRSCTGPPPRRSPTPARSGTLSESASPSGAGSANDTTMKHQQCQVRRLRNVEEGRNSPPRSWWGKYPLSRDALPQTSWRRPAGGCKRCRLSPGSVL